MKTIDLPEDLERFVVDQVRAGRYLREDDVVRDALERLRDDVTDPDGSQGPIGSMRDAAEVLDEVVEHAMKVRAAQDFQCRLVDAGLLGEIKPPIDDLTPYTHRKAVPIVGEPLSETVIKERR
ncbi:MAG: hypothetical protein NVSMB14_00770 [Isosphaeraceae bacterium]